MNVYNYFFTPSFVLQFVVAQCNINLENVYGYPDIF